MISKISKIFNSQGEFNKNVLFLMGGTIISQAIPIAVTPILTRLYTPNDFGIFASFIAIVTIINVIATGRYELAIILPKNDKESLSIVVLCMLVALFFSLFSFLIIFLFNNEIILLLSSQELSQWLYFIPISIFLTGIYQAGYYWLNRKKFYKRLAMNRIIQSSSIVTTNLSMGYYGFGTIGLILGQVIGQIIATYLIIKKMFTPLKIFLKKTKLVNVYIVAKKYKKFPIIDIPSAFLNVSSYQMIHILMNSIFNATIAGYFYLTQRIIGLPVSLVSSAITSVFQEQASKEFKSLGNAKTIFLTTLKKLFLLSFVPSIIFYLYSVELFTLVFGESWAIAGEYAKIMVPMLFFQFIASPLSLMIYIGEKQELNFYSQLFIFIMILLSFFLFDNPENVVYSLSFSFSVFYIIQFIISAKIAKVF